MLSKFNINKTFHKDGFDSLKLIHKADRSAIPLFMIFSTLKSLYPYITLFSSAYIIDSLLIKDFQSTIFFTIILIVGNFIFGIILDGLKQCCEIKSIKINKEVLIEIRKKALTLDYETLENPATLELVNTADYSMNHYGGFGVLLDNYGEIFQSIISIIASLSLVIFMCLQKSSTSGILNILTSPAVSFIVMITFLISTVIFTGYLAKHFNNKSLSIFENHMSQERKFAYFFTQIIIDYPKGKVIRLFEMKDMIIAEFDKLLKGLNIFFKKYLSFTESQAVSHSVMAGINNCFAYLFVLLKVIGGAISIGSITKYVGAIAQLNNAITELTKCNEDIRVQCEYLKSFTKFMNIENKRNTGTIPIEKRTDNEYEIEFHNVSFSYPGSSTEILKNVSCKITLKDKLAIVGRNGAGKTTFIKLLCRLYDPTSGVITLNGIDIKKYNYEEYLTLFSVVFQDFNLFAFHLGQNVSSSIDGDEEKLWKCLELAGVKERVEAMPDKLNTPLFKYDEGGVEVSGGEAQKLAIARALYKDAPFVILDEPTAALDPISEYEIYSHFDELVKDKTSIYISHRMSSCRFCNDILVFDEGRIIQRGSHDDLMKDIQNVYFKLWTSQAKYYVEA